MILEFDTNKANGYKSGAQISRVLTEGWVGDNAYCPNCGEDNLIKYADNKPVADFFCKTCNEDFELKSKSGVLGKRIVDGAYKTMIQRIVSNENPNFFFLTYNSKWTVNNFMIIPKHFFVPGIIEKRNPLAITAKRAGWVGCNIDISQIPSLGRIFIVKESKQLKRKDVVDKWSETLFIKNSSIEAKGWALDILNCVDKIPSQKFNLDEVYKFEEALKKKHPENNFVKDKIRQQLQFLRDKGILEFVSRGQYKKVRA